MMISNTLNELFVKWTYIRHYCHQKTVGNGNYDFKLTPTHWSTTYAWREVVGAFIEPSTTKAELDRLLEYYCLQVYDLTLMRWQNKVKRIQAEAIGESLLERYEDFDIPNYAYNGYEVDYLNVRYSQWFGQDATYHFYSEAPEFEFDWSSLKFKKKQNRWKPMEENVIQQVRANFEAHQGTGEPVYTLCVDEHDAKKQTEKRYIITFRDAFKTGITKLTGRIRLSEKARQALYGNKR